MFDIVVAMNFLIIAIVIIIPFFVSYVLARKKGLDNPWQAFIPLLNLIVLDKLVGPGKYIGIKTRHPVTLICIIFALFIYVFSLVNHCIWFYLTWGISALLLIFCIPFTIRIIYEVYAQFTVRPVLVLTLSIFPQIILWAYIEGGIIPGYRPVPGLLEIIPMCIWGLVSIGIAAYLVTRKYLPKPEYASTGIRTEINVPLVALSFIVLLCVMVPYSFLFMIVCLELQMAASLT